VADARSHHKARLKEILSNEDGRGENLHDDVDEDTKKDKLKKLKLNQL
jgi:hypothetical protein